MLCVCAVDDGEGPMLLGCCSAACWSLECGHVLRCGVWSVDREDGGPASHLVQTHVLLRFLN